MRFDAIHLKAFGPFTDKTITLVDSEHSDLNIIYGQNEAGKSTLLRAVDHLLFAIPRKIQDDYLHKKTDIRIGATVSHGEQSLSFLRKNGIKNSLLNPNQTVLPDDSLSPFLQGTNRDYYGQMFGLNTAQLRQGSQEILSGKGSVGEILFSASKGGSSVTQALQELRAQADHLFKSRKSKGLKIYQLIDEMKEARRQLKEDTLDPSEYARCEKRCQELTDELNAIETEIAKTERELSNLQSIEKAIPLHERSLASQRELADYQLPELPNDFPDQLRLAREQHQTANTELNSLLATLQETESQLKALPKNHLDQEVFSRIDALKEREELHKSHRNQLEECDRQLMSLRQELTSQLTELNLPSIEKAPNLPHQAEEQTLRLLVDDFGVTQAELTESKETLAREASAIKAAEEKLAELQGSVDLSYLKKLHREAQSHQQELQTHRELSQEIEELTRESSHLRKQLGIEASASSDVLFTLRLPPHESYERYRSRAQQLTDNHRQFSQDSYQLEQELGIARAKLESLKTEGALHTQEELIEARRERDEVLAQALRGQTFDAVTLQELTLRADTIADALRANSNLLAQAATLQEIISESRYKLESAQAALEKTRADQETLDGEWQALFSTLPIRILTLDDYQEAARHWRELLAQSRLLAQKKQLQASLAAKSQELLTLFVKSKLLAKQPKSFSEAAEALGEQYQTQENRQALRNDYESRLQKSRTIQETQFQNRESLQEKLSSLEKDWSLHAKGFQLPPLSELTSSSFLELQQARKNLATTQSQIENLERDQKQLQEAISSFEDNQSNLLRDTSSLFVSGQLSQQEPSVQWAFLKEQRREEAERQSRRETLQSQLDQHKQQLQEKQSQAQATQLALNGLLSSASLKDETTIGPFLVQFSKRMEVQKQVDEREDSLKQLFPDLASLKDIKELLQLHEAESLPAAISKLKTHRSDLIDQRDTIRDQRQDALARQADYQEANQTAADTQQRIAFARDELVTASKRYLTLKAAITFLTEQIEAFRKLNQGPLVQYTSDYFQKLTLGKYSGILVQPDEKDILQLYACEEKSEHKVPVTQLSEGTADQLYLSLRLAALRLHMANNKPALPLILDDILMTFDDERALAVLEVLRDFSKNCQVLIFTHHETIKSLGKKLDANLIDLEAA